MKLKDFVKDVIIEISEGITEANSVLSGKDVIINPSMLRENNGRLFIDPTHGNRVAQSLDFEVYVTASSSEDNKAGISVLTAFLGAGASNSQAENITSRNLLKFSIPVSFPIGGVTQKRRDINAG